MSSCHSTSLKRYLQKEFSTHRLTYTLWHTARACQPHMQHPSAETHLVLIELGPCKSTCVHTTVELTSHPGNAQTSAEGRIIKSQFGKLLFCTHESSYLQHLVCLQVTTLLLQLLFEARFKKGFLPVLLRHYQRLLHGWSAKPPAGGIPLDMITVQLFNDGVYSLETSSSNSSFCSAIANACVEDAYMIADLDALLSHIICQSSVFSASLFVHCVWAFLCVFFTSFFLFCFFCPCHAVSCSFPPCSLFLLVTPATPGLARPEVRALLLAMLVHLKPGPACNLFRSSTAFNKPMHAPSTELLAL